jgi:hypothetical protein
MTSAFRLIFYCYFTLLSLSPLLYGGADSGSKIEELVSFAFHLMTEAVNFLNTVCLKRKRGDEDKDTRVASTALSRKPADLA